MVAYFSQGGTTARVAGAIASGLRAAGYEIDLHDIQAGGPPDPGNYDLLGVGSPTYYYRAPSNVLDWVRNLPDLDGLPAFAFALYGTYRGDAGNDIRHALARKGARDVGYFHAKGADYYLGYLKLGYLFSPDYPTEEVLARAGEFGRHVAARLDGQDYVPAADDPPPAAIYRLERFLLHRRLIEQVYSRMFLLDKDSCAACGLCARECPTGNIAQDTEGHPVVGRNCLFCLTCQMNCPNEAITTAGWPLLWPFYKINVARATRDPALDYVRVRHSQGRTQRL
jgi:flavodoxin/ferredoxin